MRKDAMTITRPGHVAKGDDGRVSLADHFPKTASSSFLLSPHFRVLLLDESGRLQWFRSSDSQCDVMRWSVSRAKPQACKRRIGRSLPWASSRRLPVGGAHYPSCNRQKGRRKYSSFGSDRRETR